MSVSEGNNRDTLALRNGRGMVAEWKDLEEKIVKEDTKDRTDNGQGQALRMD
jgi:hypothetical protein